MICANIFKTLLAISVVLTGLAGGCEQPSEPPPREEEPYFKPGEYGGDPMEHLYNLQLSPDGSRIALIRAYTPGETFDPRDQLWISQRRRDRPGADRLQYRYGGLVAKRREVGNNFYNRFS